MLGTVRKPLSDPDQLSQLKRSLKARCGKTYSNHFFGDKTLEAAIDAGRASYDSYESGLLVFVDEQRYDRLVYFRDAGTPFPPIAIGKPLVIDEIDSNSKREEYLRGLAGELENLGWSLASDNYQVSKDLTDNRADIVNQRRASEEKLHKSGLRLSSCDASMVDQVRELWNSYLRPTDVPADHFSFLDDKRQNVICAVDSDNCLCGVNWWECKSGVCEIRHTVTHADFQHRGIGFALLIYALDNAVANDCKRAFTYIDKGNFKSIALYEKAGIVKNGRTSMQFVLG